VTEGDEKIDKRILLNHKTETITAKDRTGQLPQIMVEPTMKEIYETVFTSRTK
jgi:hypothetical protein